MDNVPFTNPLETVQFISIFSYLNALSDFLLIENYLPQIDQNKQIPVVNALYEYLEDYHYNQTMKLKLIRHLLKGSDLYGEEENENPDVVFVNTMFDYIIKSLVFNKYGNIYGFLADVVCKAESLQLNSLLEEILVYLEHATFENEFGESSILTSLAVGRIFSDIILPLFPQPKTNLHILSLDYVYAQAGSNFLKPGRINTAYYTDSKNFNTTVLDQETLFDEYLTTGLIIDNSLFYKNMSLGSLRAFALPALFIYITTEYVEKENITNIVFDPYYWKAAYESLFLYIDDSFNEIKNQMIGDANYQLHTLFLRFYKHLTKIQCISNVHCKHPSSEGTLKLTIPLFLYSTKNLQCLCQNMSPNVLTLYMHYVNEISDIFQKNDVKSFQQSLRKSLQCTLEHDNVDIHLLAPNDNVVLGTFDNETRLPYDLFEFYYPENKTIEYYALMRENYSTTLIKIADGLDDFQKTIGLSVDTLLSHRFHRIVLKLANQTMDLFYQRFITFKKLRLESYLKFSGTDRTLGEWWKEFGFTLVPFYQCEIKTANANEKKVCEKTVCKIDKLDYFHQLPENKSVLLIQENTTSLLNSLGTTSKTIFLKNAIDELSNESINFNQEYYTLPLCKRTNIAKFFMNLSLHIEEPGSEINSITKEILMFVNVKIYVLGSKTNIPFTSVENILNKIRNFKSVVSREINIIGNKTKRILYTRSQNLSTDTGYGYKFIYLSPNKIAELRTDDELKRKSFISLNHTKPDGVKIYSLVQNDTFVLENHYTFEINNQLQKRVKSTEFLGISMYFVDNEYCDTIKYEAMSKPPTECLRHGLGFEKQRYIQEWIQIALVKNANLTSGQILDTIKIYTFPDNGRMDLKFMEDWVKSKDLKLPEWGKHYILENNNLFLKLRYNFDLDVLNLSLYDGRIKIELIYTFRDRQIIERGVSMAKIIKDFNFQNARYAVTFEDYYALRNFITTGHARITGSTHEAAYMKLALYKLAIRQSDDADDEYDRTLFRFEAIPVDVVNRILSPGKIHIVPKFLTTHTSELSAINFAAVAKFGYKNILYEMKFTKPYFRAKIRQFNHIEENITTLLPGTEFSITNVMEKQFFKLGNCLKVVLRYNHRKNDKFEWYQSLMKEITRIMSKI